ncbi:hypothetical protein [Methylobacterium indicum]|uniref:hypothetical protein n=1 Tax=Methylobacterium indicum TaxID=1775910 RepID=UPI000AD76594|nr:hypothetical protein [Methylobacterium indicum]
MPLRDTAFPAANADIVSKGRCENPNGNFALFRYGPADVVEVERFDTLDEVPAG